MCLTPTRFQQGRERRREREGGGTQEEMEPGCGRQNGTCSGKRCGRAIFLILFDTISPADLLHLLGTVELLSSQSVYK